MSAPARSGRSAGSSAGSAMAAHRSPGSGTGAVESEAASSSSAVPALPSSVPSSFSSPAAPPSVTVEDESTKRCSACAEDRPVSAFSSAQLKKKGKRVCAACVSKKDAAAAAQQQAAAASSRKEAMKDAFAARLNSTPPQTVSACPCCGSKVAVRFAPCIRCSVDCCSLRCFDGHDCDLYLEAKRTMPTDLIPEEDRFHSADEIVSGWKELLGYMLPLPASVSEDAIERSGKYSADLSQMDSGMLNYAETLRLPLCDLYPPCVTRPWWNSNTSTRLGFEADSRTLARTLSERVVLIGHYCTAIFEACSTSVTPGPHDPKAEFHDEWMPMPIIDRRSACFLPGRLLHKMLTLVRWFLRAMGSEWTHAHFEQPVDVSSDAFGTLPGLAAGDMQNRLAYLEMPAPDTGQRTLVPLIGTARLSSKFCMLRQHLGQRILSMALCDGQVVLDRGLNLNATENAVKVLAVTGWTGNVMDSFLAAPAKSVYFRERWLLERAKQPSLTAVVCEELAARTRPDYFHLVLAIKRMISRDEFPRTHGSELFIATPQLGIESELVELSLLESLTEDAAAGNEQAQLLLTHIESECAAPIAEVIARQKSRLDQMLEDQAAQLRIHAEAVNRAESRARIKAPAAEGEQKADATTEASASASFASALAPTSAASSSVSAVPSAHSSSSLSGPAYSWTQSREYLGLESLREPGRKKYSTIMSAAKRLLYSLSPVSVNKRGGSHIVFHFASGKPATLVQLHAGSRSKDSTAHTTRLFAQLSEVVMQQGMAGSSAIAGAAEAGCDAAGRKLLHAARAD